MFKDRILSIYSTVNAFMTRRYVVTNGMILAAVLVIVLQAAVMLLATRLYAACVLAR